ncbi:hypothetical protein PG994_000721 [Apiospora phragmitis]|uniref:Uncharacterized protein n=1 Tax=Apiospora phragmitis TaxID=2905665 RepID=A0ABR1X757_9PEZI
MLQSLISHLARRPIHRHYAATAPNTDQVPLAHPVPFKALVSPIRRLSCPLVNLGRSHQLIPIEADASQLDQFAQALRDRLLLKCVANLTRRIVANSVVVRLVGKAIDFCVAKVMPGLQKVLVVLDNGSEGRIFDSVDAVYTPAKSRSDH